MSVAEYHKKVERFESALDSRIGSFARSVVYQTKLGYACPVCGGPKQAGYPYCYACKRERDDANRLGLKLADDVRASYYAYERNDKYHGVDQLYRAMCGYKSNDAEAAEHQNIVKYILADALAVHYPCIEECTGSLSTSWATIPSSQSSPRYGKPHVLTALVRPLMKPKGIEQIQLVANSGKTHNGINVEAFTLADESTHTDLSHVLLIEDSWVSGATVQSVAAMLHQRGASQVTVYCVARVIDLRAVKMSSLGEDIAEGYANLQYRHWCPWTHQLRTACSLFAPKRGEEE